MVEEAFKSNVLHKDIHMSLVKNLDKISLATGVPKKFIWSEDDNQVCSRKEWKYIIQCRKYRFEGSAGLVITNNSTQLHSPEAKMMLMAGKLIRNFIDARLVIVQDLLDEMKDGDKDESDVLLIPNFFIPKKGITVPDWQINNLQGLLIKRLCSSNLTILYVEDMEQLKLAYGKAMYDHLNSHYTFL